MEDEVYYHSRLVTQADDDDETEAQTVYFELSKLIKSKILQRPSNKTAIIHTFENCKLSSGKLEVYLKNVSLFSKSDIDSISECIYIKTGWELDAIYGDGSELNSRNIRFILKRTIQLTSSDQSNGSVIKSFIRKFLWLVILFVFVYLCLILNRWRTSTPQVGNWPQM